MARSFMSEMRRNIFSSLLRVCIPVKVIIERLLHGLGVICLIASSANSEKQKYLYVHIYKYIRIYIHIHIIHISSLQ